RRGASRSRSRRPSYPGRARIEPTGTRRRGMKAVVARMWGEPALLEYTEVFPPAPRPGQVLIDVKAIGCNFPDILLIQGKYQTKPPLPFTPRAGLAAVVRDVGAGATRAGSGGRGCA